MSKLFAATIQVLLEAKDQEHACDQVSELLGRSHRVQDWQYLAPAFHPPVEITEADARQHFQQYGELTEPDEDEALDLPRGPNFLYLERNGRASLFPVNAEARKIVAELTDEHGWVNELTPIDTPGSLTGPLVGERACLQDIADIDFLYAEEDGEGCVYPLSNRLKQRYPNLVAGAWTGQMLPKNAAGGIRSWIDRLGMTYIQVEMPK